ncbi:MAG: Glu-tRNA(Gln) amidotransferase subunit GatE [Candidatus Nanohaloarchaea archaeon]
MNADIDYDDLGFRCGIEIHQQLDTDTKLFCACPTDPGDQPVAAVERHLRPVPSEMGEVDRAAQFEYLQDKQFTYNVFPGVSCLVELDEEPPHPVDGEALDIALEAALLMGCTVPDEIHFMRKTVIDGSNTAGFQRTAVVGLGGAIETEHGEVAIEDVELEEDSAGIHTRSEDEAVYDLDRLGVPLIEVGTDASIRSPSHAQAVAERIGMLLRSTGQVKRGLGTIRQDVNVSIEGGARVEIKGFQELELLEELVRNEVMRQRSLVELADRLDGPIGGDIHDVTDIFAGTGNDLIDRIVESDGVVLGFVLSDLSGRMTQDLCPGLHLGKELANYAAAHGTRGMIHGDEDLDRYGLAGQFDDLRDELDAGADDVVCIIAEQEEVARQAAEAVVERADLLAERVPEETRTAEETTTRYARPLPGEARMYPETDIPPLVMADDDVAAVEQDLPVPLDEREAQLAEMIGDELAGQVVNSTRMAVFDRAVEEHGVDPEIAANVVTNVLGQVKADGVPVDQLPDDRLLAVLDLVSRGEITVDQAGDVIRDAVEYRETAVQDLADEYGTVSEDEIRSAVQDIIDEKAGLIDEQGEHAQGALMGVVMERVPAADGATVNRILSEELDAVL